MTPASLPVTPSRTRLLFLLAAASAATLAVLGDLADAQGADDAFDDGSPAELGEAEGQDADEEASAKAPPVAILEHRQELQDDGSFNYAFAADNGLTQNEVFYPDGSRTGSYSYVDPRGETVLVKYRADRFGFQVLDGSSIPTTAPQPLESPNPGPSAPQNAGPTRQASRLYGVAAQQDDSFGPGSSTAHLGSSAFGFSNNMGAASLGGRMSGNLGAALGGKSFTSARVKPAGSGSSPGARRGEPSARSAALNFPHGLQGGLQGLYRRGAGVGVGRASSSASERMHYLQREGRHAFISDLDGLAGAESRVKVHRTQPPAVEERADEYSNELGHPERHAERDDGSYSHHALKYDDGSYERHAAKYDDGSYAPHAAKYDDGSWEPHAAKYDDGSYEPHAAKYDDGSYEPHAAKYDDGRYRPHSEHSQHEE